MKIKKRQIEYIIILFIMFYPEGFRNNQTLYNVINFFQILVLVYCVVKYTRGLLKASFAIKMTAGLIVVYSIYGLISTYIITAGKYLAFRNVLLVSSLLFIASEALTKYRMDFYIALKILFLLYIIIECITNLFGLEVTFLYSLNRVYQILPCFGMILLLIGQAKGNNAYRNSIIQYIWIVLALTLFSGIYMGNGVEGGLIICSSVFIIPLIYKKSKLARLNIWWLIGIIAVIFVIFVLKNLQSGFGFLKFIIVDVLHKDMNITGRSDLWIRALGLIQANSFFGSGVNWEGIDIWYSYFQPHNQYLYEMIVGGAIGLAIFLSIIFFVALLLSKNEGVRYQICKFALFSFLLKFIFTNMAFTQNYPYWIMLIIIAAECSTYSPNILKKKHVNIICLHVSFLIYSPNILKKKHVNR